MVNCNSLNRYRAAVAEIECYGKGLGARGGVFWIPVEHSSPIIGKAQLLLTVLATAGGGWDHVSVSLKHRCPTWAEMEQVRKLFSLPGEVWIQYGVPSEAHINTHPYCLHWWRPHGVAIPMPPPLMV